MSVADIEVLRITTNLRAGQSALSGEELLKCFPSVKISDLEGHAQTDIPSTVRAVNSSVTWLEHSNHLHRDTVYHGLVAQRDFPAKRLEQLLKRHPHLKGLSLH